MGVGQARGRQWRRSMEHGTRVEWMEGGAMEEPGAVGARWISRGQPGKRPMVESTVGGAMVEEGPTTPGRRLTETEPMAEESKTEPSNRRARVTPRIRRAKAEQKAQATKAEAGHRKTAAEPE